MQIKKEILLFFALLTICITLIMAADYSTTSPITTKEQASCPSNCHKTNLQNGINASPWNFISQGILHLNV
jgi:hypothetical protein